MLKQMNRFPTLLTIGAMLLAPPVFAEDVPMDSSVMPDMKEGTDMGDEPWSDSDPVVRDLDPGRQLLLDTARREDEKDFAEAERDRDAAQRDLDAAIADGADADVVDRLTLERDTTQAALDREAGESEALADAIDALSDDQVRSVNRSLRNSNRNGMPAEIDAATLQDIADRDLNRREIQSLTKALEEVAKAERQAARFERKYEEKKREQFLRNRDRALDRGERQREKFEAKVDRSLDRRMETRDEMRDDVRREAKKGAHENAKVNAKASAKSNAKREAKRAARENVRREARANGRGRN